MSNCKEFRKRLFLEGVWRGYCMKLDRLVNCADSLSRCDNGKKKSYGYHCLGVY